MKDRLLIGILLGMLLGIVMSQSVAVSAQVNQFVTCQQSKTVWQDVSRLGRKRSAAGNMTEKHDEFTKQGWKFVDMETYIENSDLEGFFLTYSRDVACNGNYSEQP